ncbi:MAG: fimbrillin family protein [Prevotella sp.]|nr:fimbrillin family protein [Prevotella sp.]
MNKIYCKVKGLSLMAAALLMAGFITSCSQDYEVVENNSDNGVLSFKISDANATSRATNDMQTMVTKFEQGDIAGLYIVKGSEVKYSNIQLTLNDMGVWQPAVPIPVTDDMDGANFYVYYPYSEEATFDATAANPLQAYADGVTPAADQSTEEAYQQADVMVGTTAKVGDENTVSVPLSHQKALLYVELPNKGYAFTNEGLEPYVLEKAENIVFTLGEEEVQPYFDVATQSYLFLVNPGQTGIYKATYTTSGESRYYEVKNVEKIGRGQYAKHVVDGGVQLQQFGELAAGDMFCADGKLVSKDATILPDNVVGVVFKVGTTDAMKAVNSKWSHAVVLALGESASKLAWGTTSVNPNPFEKNDGANWYKNDPYNLVAPSNNNSGNWTAETEAELSGWDGYVDTQKWMSIPEDMMVPASSADPIDLVSIMHKTLNDYAEANPLPEDITTGWYLPTLHEWKAADTESSILTTQLAKAEATALGAKYWSSVIGDARSVWSFVIGKDAISDRYKRERFDQTNFFRFVFAF